VVIATWPLYIVRENEALEHVQRHAKEALCSAADAGDEPGRSSAKTADESPARDLQNRRSECQPYRVRAFARFEGDADDGRHQERSVNSRSVTDLPRLGGCQ
jgi:hypothetical protein